MDAAQRRSKLDAIGRALRHRNYRLFFFGQGTSLIGTWLTRVATSWLVYRLTGSPWLLGLVGFASQIPTFALSPFAGVLVDRWNRHRVLVVTQTLAMVQSALLAFFALAGTIGVPHILALSVFQGLINAFDVPARQAFVVEMVEDRADLPNAIALNSSMVNAARLVGPSVGGLLIAAVGEGYCFALDAVSYLAVIGSLLAMRRSAAPPAPRRTEWVADLREGLAYIRGSTPIHTVLGLLAIFALAGMPYMTLMPIFAGNVLHGGAHTLGWLMGAAGGGAVAGVLWLASRPSVLGLGRVVARSGVLFSLGLIAFSLSRSLWLSLPLVALTGCGMMVLMAASNTLVQTWVDEDKRGRVMSFYAMSLFGMAPLGNLLSGHLGQTIGAPETLRWGGVVTLAAVGLFVRKLPELRNDIRAIYVRRGILPQPATSLAS